MSAAVHALAVARAAGVVLRVDRADLLVTAHGRPPAEVIDLLVRHKQGIVRLLAAEACSDSSMDPGDAANINAWLDSIGEHDPVARAAVFAKCAESPEACALVVGVAVSTLLGWNAPGSESPDALRTCGTCAKLSPSGLCCTAVRSDT